MSTPEIIEKIAVMQEYQSIMDEASAIVEGIKDELKRHMDMLGVEHLEAGSNVLHFVPVVSLRLNSNQLKKDLPELYRSYLRESTSRRFSIT